MRLKIPSSRTSTAATSTLYATTAVGHVTADLVDDVVADTFLTAWRRLDDVPAGDAARLWLYRVAYRVIGHSWRSTTRRRRLDERLRLVARHPDAAADECVIADADRRVLAAADCLNHTDAEVLGHLGVGTALDC